MAAGEELISLIDREIPDGRKNLQENYRNLENVAKYCEDYYLRANPSDKAHALQETKNYTTHSLASVAYQINNLATNFLKLLDLQQSQLTDMESSVNHLNQFVMIHKEKVARREIGVLTSGRSVHRPLGMKNGIIYPEQNERPIKYTRKSIDYTILDDIGHGVRQQQQQQQVTVRSPSISSTHSNSSTNNNQAPTTKPPTPPVGRVGSSGTIGRASGDHRQSHSAVMSGESSPPSYGQQMYSRTSQLPGSPRGLEGAYSHHVTPTSNPLPHDSAASYKHPQPQQQQQMSPVMQMNRYFYEAGVPSHQSFPPEGSDGARAQGPPDQKCEQPSAQGPHPDHRFMELPHNYSTNKRSYHPVSESQPMEGAESSVGGFPSGEQVPGGMQVKQEVDTRSESHGLMGEGVHASSAGFPGRRDSGPYSSAKTFPGTLSSSSPISTTAPSIAPEDSHYYYSASCNTSPKLHVPQHLSGSVPSSSTHTFKSPASSRHHHHHHNHHHHHHHHHQPLASDMTTTTNTKPPPGDSPQSNQDNVMFKNPQPLATGGSSLPFYSSPSALLADLAKNDCLLSIAEDYQIDQFTGSEENVAQALCQVGDNIVMRFVHWMKQLPFYKEIPKELQTEILMSKWHELLLLIMTAYGPVTKHWAKKAGPKPSFSELFSSNMSRMQEYLEKSFGKYFSVEQLRAEIGPLMEKVTAIMAYFWQLAVTRKELLCLMVILLLSHESAKKETVLHHIASSYKQALQQYILERFPSEANRLGDLLQQFASIEAASAQLLSSKMIYIPFLLNS